ncbi:hypothetical protein [Alphaproteobacteria bacterium endosymbiont of Tiliacea citrago]|uniref:hypothetical protein n=1 Tax=Alphaproteobacteria bacterium endosymbiont of Tiliacea citrago TaxID=3077944 RepID=UPI00313BE903
MISIKENFNSIPFSFFFDLENKRVIVTAEKTSVMCHLTIAKEDVSCSFSESGCKPLKVTFESRFNSINKIPGGFKKKDFISDFDITLSRLIDRCVRPLFPSDFNKDVNLYFQVLSYDDYSLEVVSVLASSLSLLLFGVTEFPVSLCKVSGGNINKANKKDVKFRFLASFSSQPSSLNNLDYLTENTMVDYECFSDLVLKNSDSYKSILDKAFKITCSFAEDMNRLQYKIISEIKGHPSYKLEPINSNSIGFFSRRSAWGFSKKLFNSFLAKDRSSFNLKDFEKDCGQNYVYNSYVRDLVSYRFAEHITRNKKRIDGRSLFDPSSLLMDIREQSLVNQLVAGVSNCNFFSRGNTQIISSISIGDSSNVQWIDSIDGKTPESFIVNYNFLSHLSNKKSVGGSRREIGHSELIKKAIKSCLLDKSNVIRVVCDVVSCDGGSSMSSVCGTSILLYQKKLIKNLIAGVSIGLIKHEEKTSFIVDLNQLEDEFLSLIDCKVTGTTNSITSIQLDSKKTCLNSKDFYEILNTSIIKLNEVLNSMETLLASKTQSKLTQEVDINFQLNELSESNGLTSDDVFNGKNERSFYNREKNFAFKGGHHNKEKRSYGKSKVDISKKDISNQSSFFGSDSVKPTKFDGFSDESSINNDVCANNKMASEYVVLNIDTAFLKDVLLKRDIEVTWLSKKLGVSFSVKGHNQLCIHAKQSQNLADAIKFIKHLVKER